jgi:hypothetical protein
VASGLSQPAIEVLTMTTKIVSNPIRATLAPPVPESAYTEETTTEIRAYLARVCPLRDCAELDDGEEYRRGRSLIERLAISAEGKVAPTVRLSPSQCADVIFVGRNSEPADPRSWFTEPDDEPSHLLGLCVILGATERSLGAQGGAS